MHVAIHRPHVEQRADDRMARENAQAGAEDAAEEVVRIRQHTDDAIANVLKVGHRPDFLQRDDIECAVQQLIGDGAHANFAIGGDPWNAPVRCMNIIW